MTTITNKGNSSTKVKENIPGPWTKESFPTCLFRLSLSHFVSSSWSSPLCNLCFVQQLESSRRDGFHWAQELHRFISGRHFLAVVFQYDYLQPGRAGHPMAAGITACSDLKPKIPGRKKVLQAGILYSCSTSSVVVAIMSPFSWIRIMACSMCLYYRLG